MTRIEVPICLRFLRIPATWEIRTIEDRTCGEQREFAFSKVQDDGSLDFFKVVELDGWQCREEFFDLAEGDKAALLKFLTKVGVWFQSKRELADHWSTEVMQHYREGNPQPIDVRSLWNFQKELKKALVQKKAFQETYTPLLSRPETGFELAEQQSGLEFPLRLELTNVASGVVTFTDAYHMLLATVFFDVARGIRFKTCERDDCRTPFPLENKRHKKFCCWDCAHITTVRRNRPHKGRKKRQKSLR